jgi:hypothetical protein
VNDSNATISFSPGLYCVQNDVTINGEGVEVTTFPADEFEGITIYSIDGAVTINGTATVELVAPKMDTSTTPATEPDESVAAGAIPGMLIYMDPNNSNGTVRINGGADTFVRGTILNPDGTVTIEGNSENDEWYAQVIANEIFLGGGATLNITYNGEDVWWGEAFMGLEK